MMLLGKGRRMTSRKSLDGHKELLYTKLEEEYEEDQEEEFDELFETKGFSKKEYIA